MVAYLEHTLVWVPTASSYVNASDITRVVSHKKSHDQIYRRVTSLEVQWFYSSCQGRSLHRVLSENKRHLIGNILSYLSFVIWTA